MSCFSPVHKSTLKSKKCLFLIYLHPSIAMLTRLKDLLLVTKQPELSKFKVSFFASVTLLTLCLGRVLFVLLKQFFFSFSYIAY